MRRFDTQALFDAMNSQRIAHQLTWEEVAREIGVAASTLQRTRSGGRLEVDGMLAMVHWLKVPVEHFVRDSATNT